MGHHFPKVHRCVFGCGRKADSKEHGWSDWASGVIPFEGISGMVDGQPYENPLQKNLRIKCVCKQCNETWMKAMEDFAVLTVGVMMLDKPLTLNIPQQQVLARWAVKHAMVFEFTSRLISPFYTDHDRLVFRTEGTIPSRTAVWIARAVNVERFYARGNKLTLTAHNDLTYQFSPFTFAYGHFVVQVASIRPDEENDFVVVPDGNEALWGRRKTLIWPTGRTTIRWPPADTVPVGQIDSFHERFRGMHLLLQ